MAEARSDWADANAGLEYVRWMMLGLVCENGPKADRGEAGERERRTGSGQRPPPPPLPEGLSEEVI